MAALDARRQLVALSEAYVGKVNSALEGGRETVACELAADYLEESLRVLTTGSHPDGAGPA